MDELREFCREIEDVFAETGKPDEPPVRAVFRAAKSCKVTAKVCGKPQTWWNRKALNDAADDGDLDKFMVDVEGLGKLSVHWRDDGYCCCAPAAGKASGRRKAAEAEADEDEDEIDDNEEE